jgi:hypothetical protein
VRTGRGEADFEGASGELRGLMRQGCICAVSFKHDGCISATPVEGDREQD